MLKRPAGNSHANRHKAKKSATSAAFKKYLGPLASGLNRRAFLRTSAAVTLLGGLTACKPSISKESTAPAAVTVDSKTLPTFDSKQRALLDAVTMHLFPDDGDGPSARDIKAVDYLEWAMTDPQNIDDGDPEFIGKGIGWLEDLARQTRGDSFIRLKNQQQDKVLKQIAGSSAGENWLSLLMYYLTEALLLDPVYGGNPDQIGWQWLEHQPGFPRPESGKTYRDFS